MDILMGLLIGIIGLTLATSGLRVFFFMLPIVGMVTGFFAGAHLINSWLGDGFLSTATGWIVGIVLGLLFAAISYLWWYVGALMSAGASGALLFSGIFSAFGVNSGVLLVSIGIVGAALFIFGAMILNLPIYVVLVNTAIVGAYMVVGGLMLIFGSKNLGEFDWGIARAAATDNWFWWIILVAVAVFGMLSQMKLINTVRLPEEKWVKAEAV